MRKCDASLLKIDGRLRDDLSWFRKQLLLKNKIPLPVNQGRNLFGVADVTGELKAGQCFIQYRDLQIAWAKEYHVLEGNAIAP